MEDKSFIFRRRLVIGLIIAFVLGTIAIVILTRPSQNEEAPIDPNTESLIDGHDGTGDGKTSAVLYNSGNIYIALGESDDVLHTVAEDLLLFARTTLPELKDTNALVGFTFSKDFEQKDGAFVYTGYFYGVSDKIEITLRPHGRGVYTLSVTNLQNGTNIDSQLSLNGQRNTYIQTLPIEKGTYSIRYQVPQDRIVVTFYDGYTSQDVDDAVASITSGLGKAVDPGVIYSINRVGIVTIDQVRQNLVTPLSSP